MQVARLNGMWLTKSRIFCALIVVLGLVVGCGQPTPTPIVIAPFVGPTWEWTGTDYTAGSVLRVPNPDQYRISFQADGTYIGKADCNSISGTYTFRGSTLKINPGPSTLAACPPGSLDLQFTSQLAAAESFVMRRDNLDIDLERRGGTMEFRAVESVAALTPSPIPVTVIPTSAAPPAPTTVPTNAPPTNTPLPSCPGLPRIEFFRAEPATINRGQNSVLRWGSVTNATTVAIDQGIGGVGTPGSVVVAPAQTTTYIMTAVGCGGQVQASTVVVVNQPTAPPAPTQVPPTAVPPTAVPPTQPPPPTAAPTQAPPTVAPGADLFGLWRWTQMRLQDGSVVTPPNPNQYTITFQPGAASMLADCNQATGTWSVAGNNLSISILTKTSALCGEESLSEQYLAWLGQANTYTVSGPTLNIDLKQDSGRMTLNR